MSKIGAIAMALVAAPAIVVLAAGTASAAPAEWMLNGKTLSEEGLNTAALKTTAKTDKPLLLSSAGLTIECKGNVEAKKPEIIKASTIKNEALIATECKATKPAACTVSTTIGTVPVESELTLDGVLATKAIVHPESGKIFTTIAVTGSECAATGNKPVSGDFEVLAPEGQGERAGQLIDANQGSTGLLKLGAESGSISGSALVLLANSAAWSFL